MPADYGGSSAASSSAPALKGYQARHTYKHILEYRSPEVRKYVCEQLADNLNITEDKLTPLSMREFFEEQVPLGANKQQARRLTELAMLVSRLWELDRKKDRDGISTLIHILPVYVEQIAVDNCYKRESAIPWFLTGLREPNHAATARNVQHIKNEPFASLADPRWIQAQMAYLQDVDAFSKRMKDPSMAVTDEHEEDRKTRKQRQEEERAARAKAAAAAKAKAEAKP